jgi:hypothetical protein
MPIRTWYRNRPGNPAVVAVLALAGLAACGGGGGGGGGGGTGPSPATTTYTGFITADDGSSGGLTLTFASAVSLREQGALLTTPVAATGTISVVGGGTINLTGSVDAGVFTATGGGLTLTGTLEQTELNGRFTGPGGVEGGFAAAGASPGHAVGAYCGTYTGNAVGGGTESGSWHFLVAGTHVIGDILPDGQPAGAYLTGFLGDAAVQGNGATTVSVNINAGGDGITADGSIDAAGTTVTGTYSTRFAGLGTLNSDGTFDGSKCPGT